MVWARGIFGFAIGLLLVGLAACHSNVQMTTGASCFPAEASRWIPTTSGRSGQAVNPVPATSGNLTATIYSDRSGSMLGYVVGGTSFESPFVDLIQSLPDTLATIGLQTRYRPFDRRPPMDLPDGRNLLQRADSYRCFKPQKAECDNQESHIDAALSEIAHNPDGMAIILSDLWFSNSEIRTTGDTALQPLLTQILGSGRLIDVYGINSPFSGQIADIPNASGNGTFSVAFKGQHPLYMIVVGTQSQVVAFHAAMGKSGSHIANDFSAHTGRIRRSVFALRPDSGLAASAEPFAAAAGPVLRQARFEPEAGVAVQQFVFDRQGVASKSASGLSANWTGPRDDAFLDGAVWHGPVKGKTYIWQRKNTQCKGDASWIRTGTTTDGWSDAGPGLQSFKLTPSWLSSRLRTSNVFVISGELERTSLDIPGDQDAWMHTNWSVSPEKAAAAASQKPSLFPTLNLSEFARLMENALADAAEHHGAAISGFTIMVSTVK